MPWRWRLDDDDADNDDDNNDDVILFVSALFDVVLFCFNETNDIDDLANCYGGTDGQIRRVIEMLRRI